MIIRYFAAAAEAARRSADELQAATLGELTAALKAEHGPVFASVLGRCSLLLDGVNVSDPDTPLAGATHLDVLPPFAGG